MRKSIKTSKEEIADYWKGKIYETFLSIKNPIDLSNFAEKYCDGSGHMYAAGGKVTPLFMEFTKKLKIL
jgi:hypothetical protein